MSQGLLQPPSHLPPSSVLQLSQQAPIFLQNSSAKQSSSLIPFLSQSETAETWTIYEHLLLSCLRTRDDKSARLCLKRLTERFGADNHRVMGLKGMLQEAVAEGNSQLNRILEEYSSILAEDPTNTPIAKRRIALLRSLSRPVDAISALTALLDASPTDAEAWAELSDLYYSQGLLTQSIFSLEEVLLIVPSAWNVHARLGELCFISATSPSISDSSSSQLMADSIRRFCRSIELCDDYLRGYYGLKLATQKYLTGNASTDKSSSSAKKGEESNLLSKSVAEKLNAMATKKLSEIVRRNTAGEQGWGGYEKAEIIAARELLDRDTLVAQE